MAEVLSQAHVITTFLLQMVHLRHEIESCWYEGCSFSYELQLSDLDVETACLLVKMVEAILPNVRDYVRVSVTLEVGSSERDSVQRCFLKVVA